MRLFLQFSKRYQPLGLALVLCLIFTGCQNNGENSQQDISRKSDTADLPHDESKSKGSTADVNNIGNLPDIGLTPINQNPDKTTPLLPTRIDNGDSVPSYGYSAKKFEFPAQGGTSTTNTSSTDQTIALQPKIYPSKPVATQTESTTTERTTRPKSPTTNVASTGGPTSTPSNSETSSEVSNRTTSIPSTPSTPPNRPTTQSTTVGTPLIPKIYSLPNEPQPKIDNIVQIPTTIQTNVSPTLFTSPNVTAPTITTTNPGTDNNTEQTTIDVPEQTCSTKIVSPEVAGSFSGVIKPEIKNKKKADYAVLNEQFINGVYSFGTSEWANSNELSRQMNITWPALNEKLLRLLALNNINVIDTGTRQINQILPLAQKYDMKIMAFDNAFQPKDTELNYAAALKKWSDNYLKLHLNSEDILSWRVLDEPPTHRSLIKGYTDVLKNVRADFFKLDKLHPVSVITNTASPAYSQEADLYFGEIYNFLYADSQGREDFSLIEKNMREASATARHINAYTLWANGMNGSVPDRVDIRNMMYLTLANGGNGWLWYRGTGFPPRWAEYTPALNYELLRQSSLADNFESPSPLLDEIKSVSDDILPLGTLFTQATFLKQHPIKAQSCAYQIVGTEFSDTKKLLETKTTTQASVNVGVWDTGDVLLLVLHNRNLKKSESVSVQLAQIDNTLSVYDGTTLAKQNLASNRDLSLLLPPGGGHVYILASPAGMAKVEGDIYKNRYRKDKRQYLALNDTWKSVLNSSYALEFSGAQQAYQLGDWKRASDTMTSLLEDINDDLVSNNKVASGISELKKLRSLLYDAGQLIRQRLPLLVKENEPTKFKSNQRVDELGDEDSHLKNALLRLRSITRDFYPTVAGLESGISKSAADLTTMRASAQLALNELNDWKPMRDISQARVGFVRLGKSLSDPIFDIASCGRYGAKNFEELQFSNNRLMNKLGQERKASDYDVVWVHENSEKNNQTGSSQNLITWLANYLKTGKGLLLSGHATELIPTLYPGNAAPKKIEDDVHGFYTALQRDDQYTKWQQIGLAPSPDFVDHPIFDGLDTDAIWMGHESLQRVRDRSSWKYPVIPQGGKILAGFTSGLRPPANDVNYDLVEFSEGSSSKAMALGDDICDLRKSASGVEHARNTIKLLSNIYTYLGSKSTAYPGHKGLEGPVYIRNLANSQDNLNLSWYPSSGSNPDAMFDSIFSLGQRWETTVGNSSIDIDFGNETSINKVHLFVGWTGGTTANVGHASISAQEPKSDNFKKIEGTSTFNGNGYYGITFDFDPIRTEAIRIEGLRPYPIDSNNPIGITEIMIYGE